MAVFKKVGETNTGVIFQVVKANAEKRFPGVEVTKIALRCGAGCIQIELDFPRQYLERIVTLKTDPVGDSFNPQSLIITISLAPTTTEENLRKLLDVLTEGLPAPTPPAPQKSIFDEL